jgi:hypothetical protein
VGAFDFAFRSTSCRAGGHVGHGNVADASAAGSAQSGLSDDHPPKPALTLRVGISGHRPKANTFPPAAQAYVPDRLRDVFAAIDQVLEQLKPANRGFYAEGTDGKIHHNVRLVSGLAEGADQIAVKARPENWEVDAILPFPIDEYLKDFKNPAQGMPKEAIADFEHAKAQATTIVQLPCDPLMPSEVPTDSKEEAKYWQIRSQAYARLGRFLLGQIDLLVAVWDGLREEGPGGTGEVIRGALHLGIPVIWISTVANVAPRLIKEFAEDDVPVMRDGDLESGSLMEALSTVVSIPMSAPEPVHGATNPSARARLKDFYAETWPKATHSVTYDLFKRLVEGKKLRLRIVPPSRDDAQRELETFINATPPQAAPFRDRVREILAPRYAWADQLAIERSNWYRSAYINCYLLAAFLVAIALLGVFVHDIFDHNEAAMLAAKCALVLIELGLIGLIFWTVKKGREFRWQGRWVEYRALAEMFRSVPFLAYLGEHGNVQRSQELEPASSAWFLWYLRATIRELGLPSAVLDDTYQTELLDAVKAHVIEGQYGQLKYNRDTAATLAQMHHRLHVFGDFCFILTAILLGVFFVAYAAYIAGEWYGGKPFLELIGSHTAHAASSTGPPSWLEALGHLLQKLKSFVTYLAALLPALGATVFGIRETGDFEGFSKRAAQTAEKLAELKRNMEKRRRRLTLDETSVTLLATAQVLSEDVGAWQSVYGRKQLGFPA